MSDVNGVCCYIPDGYTQEAFIRGDETLFPDVRLTYRPVLVLQQAQINQEMAAANDIEKAQWIAARWMVQQIVTWDIKKPDGSAVNHNDQKEVLHLRPALFARLWDIINGTDGGDVDRTASASAMHSRAQREQAMATRGLSGEEIDEGN